MSEACSASSLSRFKAHSHFHFHSRRVDFTHARALHQARIAALRAESLLSFKQTLALNDAVEASDESEDDLGDEPRDALPQGSPVSPVIAFECVSDASRPTPVPRPLARESYPFGSDRLRFLSLCRLLI
ncbi:hypothetical protein [Singulisphaera sp. GP187]|uniref:hypothetical protein n=1 Tax=Singulisphaera sp. GP187 TaxID=1882752 RepID=UPI0020B13D9A|nr:hypothetical protein [Singulisphaera sp. GP187]